MEKLIYTAASGAELNRTALHISANNLANIDTVGFKSDMEQATAMMIQGTGFRTRYQAQMNPVSTDLSAGPAQQTGRKLDVYVSEGGFIQVADERGAVAYTRAGSLNVASEGTLRSGKWAVQGAQGNIQLPEFGDIDISHDGTVNLLPVGGGVIIQDERIQLVNAEGVRMEKGEDGLFRPQNGGELPDDGSISLKTGVLEGSNVNAIDEMVNTMLISRQFEMNVRMMRTADQLADAGNKLISGNS